MKKSVLTTQVALVIGSLILIFGLVLAPRLSKETRLKTETNPNSLELQQAVALVQNGENPMKGIMMMREMLEKDSTNVDVHWQLAQFSLTSRQIQNAALRFSKVIEFDTDQKYPQAYFWLAQTQVELDNREEAIPLLEKYLTLETDTVVITGVKQMLDKLKEDIH